MTKPPLSRCKSGGFLWKTVSPAESAFLGYLTGVGKQWFSIDDAYAAFPDKSEGAVRFMLMRMLDKGLLIKVSKKVYWVVPFDQDAVAPG